MKRFAMLLLGLCLLLAACGSPEVPEATHAPTEAPTEVLTEAPAEAPTEAPTEAPSAKIVSPLPSTIDINALDNCTVAVSMEKSDIHGSTMTVTVYTYDLYDMVDIALLQGGDTIIIRGQEVVIEALDRTEGGLVLINGGLDMGGYDLWTNENTVYFETGYSDMKHWQSLGEVTMEVAPDFRFTDSSDPEKEPVIYTFEDLTGADSPIDFAFDPQSTTVTIENGQIVSMERTYTP